MLSQIKALCDADPAREVCGVVVLDKRSQEASVIPVPNVVQGMTSIAEFSMEPLTWASIQRTLRRGRDATHEVVYRFHSHPRWLAWPSPMDIGAARYPQREIIYSVSFNTFFCYAPKDYADKCSSEFGFTVKSEPLGNNDLDAIVATELTEYATKLPLFYGDTNTYEDFSNWSRRHR